MDTLNNDDVEILLSAKSGNAIYFPGTKTHRMAGYLIERGYLRLSRASLSSLSDKFLLTSKGRLLLRELGKIQILRS